MQKKRSKFKIKSRAEDSADVWCQIANIGQQCDNSRQHKNNGEQPEHSKPKIASKTKKVLNG